MSIGYLSKVLILYQNTAYIAHMILKQLITIYTNKKKNELQYPQTSPPLSLQAAKKITNKITNPAKKTTPKYFPLNK